MAFLVGWFLCLSVITAGTLLLTGGEPPSSGSIPSTAALALLAGSLVLGQGVRRWRRSEREAGEGQE